MNTDNPQKIVSSATCYECAGTGKCGPDEDPNEMDCEVCNGSGQLATPPDAPDNSSQIVSDLKVALTDLLHNSSAPYSGEAELDRDFQIRYDKVTKRCLALLAAHPVAGSPAEADGGTWASKIGVDADIALWERLTPAIREFRRNDGGPGRVLAYDMAVVDREFGALPGRLARAPLVCDELMREAAAMLHDSMFQFCDTSDRAHELSKRITAALTTNLKGEITATVAPKT